MFIYMPVLVDSISVTFGDDSPKNNSVKTYFRRKAIQPLGKSIALSNKDFCKEYLHHYFNRNHSPNIYFNTLAFKQQIGTYDCDDKFIFPHIKTQIHILSCVIHKLIKNSVVQNIWCVFEPHKCGNWFHIHFLSTSKYALQNYKRLSKKTLYSVIENYEHLEFTRDSQAYRQSAFKIEPSIYPEKIYGYMKKMGQISCMFPEIYYLYYDGNVKRKLKNKILKKNIDFQNI